MRRFALSLSIVVTYGLTCSLGDTAVPLPAPVAPSIGVQQPRAVTFVANRGQWDHRVLYRAVADQVSAWIVHDGWRLALTGERRGAAIDLKFEQSSRATIRAEGDLGNPSHWLIGGRDEWIRDVPAYGRLRFHELYDGIDVVLRDREGQIEYDLVLRPGADLGSIAIRCEGAAGLRVDDDGSLVIETGIGELRQPPPETWVTDPTGKRIDVPCRYELLDDHRFGFAVAGWDGAGPLTIDPVLVWSTFVGGNRVDTPHDVATAANGDVVVVGSTASSQYPLTTGVFDRTFAGQTEAFVARIESGGRRFSFVTYLGGDAADTAQSVQLAADGSVYVGGTTFSGDFPTTANALRRSNAMRARDAFVAHLSGDGRQLNYGTLFGGAWTRNNSAWDDHTGLYLDRTKGWLYVTGATDARDASQFPLTSDALSRTGRAYLSILDFKSDPSKPALHYSTRFGGVDTTTFVAPPRVDAGGIVTIGGTTVSRSWPTTSGAFLNAPPANAQTGFIVRIDPSKGPNGLVYSTLFGGTGREQKLFADADARGIVHIGGYTTSGDLPTTSTAYRKTRTPGWSAFVARLDPSKSGNEQLLYSTYFGSSEEDQIHAMHLASDGVITLTGGRAGSDLPVTSGAWQTAFTRDPGFVVRLDPGRAPSEALRYCSWIRGCGGTVRVNAINFDEATSIATLAVFITSTFAVTRNAAQPRPAGNWDAAVLRLKLVAEQGTTTFGTSCPGTAGTPQLVPQQQPELCHPYRVLLRDARSGQGALMFFGRSKTAWGALPLPFRLDPIGMPGCTLYTDGTLTFPFATGTGSVRFGFTIPAAPGLIGLTFYHQAVFQDPGANRLGLVATNGVELRIRS